MMMGYETFYPQKMDEYNNYMDQHPHQHWAPYAMPPGAYDPMFQHMMAPQQMMSSQQHIKRDPMLYNPPPVSPPPQRERFSYTRYQLELLNNIYDDIRYPNSMQKQLIAKRVGITREQVKIWFQNRRRKDVTGKGKDVDRTGPQMVPDTIMQGVMVELKSYKSDTRGKKLDDGGRPPKKRKRDPDEYEEDSSYKRMCQYDEASNCSADSVFKPEVGSTIHDIPLGRDSFNSITPSPSSETSENARTAPSDISADPVYPVSIVPASNVIDMMNPPNMISPDAPLDTLLCSRPPSVESPVDTVHVQSPAASSESGSVDRDLHTPQPSGGEQLDCAHTERITSSHHRDQQSTPPPNKIAPPSAPISLSGVTATSVAEIPCYSSSSSHQQSLSSYMSLCSAASAAEADDVPHHTAQPLVKIQNYTAEATDLSTNSAAAATASPSSSPITNDPEPSSCAKSASTGGSGGGCTPEEEAAAAQIQAMMMHMPPLLPTHPSHHHNMFANWFPNPGSGSGSGSSCQQLQQQQQQHQQQQQQKDASGFAGMFPFPMMMPPSEPPMMMPPPAMYRDHYAPIMIGAFSNPYFNNNDHHHHHGMPASCPQQKGAAM